MKKCPYCAEEIQDEAAKCKHCNEWQTDLKTEHSIYERIESNRKNLFAIGVFLLVIGVLITVLAFNMSVSISRADDGSQVVNLNLLSNREILIEAGLFISLMGFISIVAGRTMSPLPIKITRK